ncbi:MAG: hypothetical protein J3K34DRAFT_508565 [Monoraphidium minutum]|nr:MAG: hypothetical protein J3K34DRAFT_508565 [Monoraphidium minutum]
MMGQVSGSDEPFSVFVGDLTPEISDFVLMEAFRQFYPSVTSAKVITDPSTGRSKGYGFVRFTSEPERDRALEMQGFNLGGRPIRVSLATARRAAGGGGGGGAAASQAPHPAELDPTNTTLFIGGLSAGVSEEQLRAVFGQYGEIVYTKIPAGKGCGFVQFVDRPVAEMAMASLNGQVMGATAIRISWGRSTSRAPSSARAAAAAAGLGGGGGAPLGALGGVYGGLPMGAAGALGLGYPAVFGGGAFVNGAQMLGQAPAGYGGGFAVPGGAAMQMGGLLPAGLPPQQHAMLGATGALQHGGGGAPGGAPNGGALVMSGYGLGVAGGGGGGGGMQFDPTGGVMGGADKMGGFGGGQPQQQHPQQLLGGAAGAGGGAYMLPPN